MNSAIITASFAPPPFLLPLGLAFIMLAMGLTLKFDDFAMVARRPVAILAGLATQLVILPLTAFLLASHFSLPPAFAVGLMLLAACPGGITSNMITHLARGDVALSVSLTAISSLLGMLSVPFIANFALVHFMGAGAVDLPVWRMALGLLAVSTLPVLMGMTLNQFAPRLAARLERFARPISLFVFALIVLGAFASSWPVMMANLAVLGPPVILLNLGVMTAGWLLARILGQGVPQGVAIALEGGMQNGAMGIFVAMNLLHDKAIMLPSISYALMMNLGAAMVILWRLQRGFARAG
jgi:BASS family bile acid:Na+ symporter